MKIQNLSILMILFVFVATLINLAFIPIAWVDEIMDLDPALNWVNGKGYQSKLWAYEGSDKLFLANLPLRNLPFVVSTWLGGADIFGVRLPHLFFWALALFFVFKTLLHFADEKLAWIFLLIFVFDKGIYESLRSARCEMMQVLLFSSSFYYGIIRNYKIVAFTLCGLLFATHPASWVLAFGIAIFVLIRSFQKSDLLKFLLFFSPSFIWLVLTGFDWQGIQMQLLEAGKEHSVLDLDKFAVLKGHFWDRYRPYLFAQFWIWIIGLAAHFFSILIILRPKTHSRSLWILCLLFLAHSMYWLTMLAPNYRYNPTLILMSIFIVAAFASSFFNKIFSHKFSVALLPLHAAPVFIIILLGFIQRNERNPYTCIDWLSESKINTENSLICGESIAYYFIANKQSTIEYCEPNYPHKFNFENYENLYILTVDEIEADLISVYEPTSKFKSIEKYIKKIPSRTYNGLKIYKVNAEQMHTYCLKIRNGDSW